MRSSKPAVGCRRETDFRRKTSDKSGKTLIEDKMRTQSNNMHYGMSTNKRRSRDASVNGGDTVEIHARAIYPDRQGRLSPDSEIRADLCAICRWSRFPGRLRTWQMVTTPPRCASAVMPASRQDMHACTFRVKQGSRRGHSLN